MIGMMGVGKSALGSALAKRMSLAFADMDTLLTEAEGQSVSDIFHHKGEPYFRQKEAELLQKLLDTPPQVIATGGGVFTDPKNRERIQQSGTSIWLQLSIDNIVKNIADDTTRPLLQVADKKATLQALLTARSPAYAKADFVLGLDGLSKQEALHRLEEIVQ